MSGKKTTILIICSGIVTGIMALLLTDLGNPANMGFCIACFLRDTAGALKLHSAAAVQYVRPEIIGLILGAVITSSVSGEFRPRAGSAPVLRFFIGAFVMVGALVFLGCPLRMVLRMGGGDLNAFVGFIGFFIGVLIGVFFLNRGFSLPRSYKVPTAEGCAMPAAAVILLVLFISVPSLFVFSESGPGSKHAPIVVALAAGLTVGAMAQRSRLCMVGGLRDAVMFRDFHLLCGFAAVFVTVLAGNLILGNFKLGIQSQPIAHSSELWNAAGMVLVGWGSVMLGGCPLRQLILTGEGNADSAVTVLGMIVGAAFAHNFGLAGSADSLTDGVYKVGGISTNGKIAVIIGAVIFLAISLVTVLGNKSALKKGGNTDDRIC